MAKSTTEAPAAAPSLFLDGPIDGATAVPDTAVLSINDTVLSVPTATGTAIYLRTGDPSPAWRFARLEPVYR